MDELGSLEVRVSSVVYPTKPSVVLLAKPFKVVS
jgi:hypothetical protein